MSSIRQLGIIERRRKGAPFPNEQRAGNELGCLRLLDAHPVSYFQIQSFDRVNAGLQHSRSNQELQSAK